MLSADQTRDDVGLLLNAKSVAIVGASQKSTKIGRKPLEFLKKYNYKGQVFPVNPKYKHILGYQCYPDLKEIPSEVDLCLIAVPAKYVLDVLVACAEKGIKSAVVFSSGFAEMGAEGKRKQEQIAHLAKTAGIRICGPNSNGFINASNNLTATFTTALERLEEIPSGNIAFVSQSGGFASYIYTMAQERGLFFNYWVTLGNEADLEFGDFITFLAKDDTTKAIGCFLEGIKDSSKLVEAADIARNAGKPIVLVKVGKSQRGAQAAQSHTGKMVGSDEVYDSVFRQLGILRVDNVQELLDVLSLISQDFSPAGNCGAVLTVSGGAGVWCADKCEELGIRLPQLSQSTVDQLEGILPAFASFLNPIDFTGQLLNEPGLLKKCLKAVLGDPGIDFLVIVTGLQERIGGRIARDIRDAVLDSDKPVAVAWIVGPEEAYSTLKEASIPVFRDMAQCIQTVAHVLRLKEVLNRGQTCGGQAGSPKIAHRGISWPVGSEAYTEDLGKTILKELGITVPHLAVAGSEEEAVCAANRIGYPVVLKALSAQLKHKTETGAVACNLETGEDVVAAYHKIHRNVSAYYGKALLTGIMVEEMIAPGLEVNVSAFHDTVFGPMIAFGLGGVYVEVLKDITMRMAPIDACAAEEMIKESRASVFFRGFRGSVRRDIDATVEILVRISQLIAEYSDHIRELELNPVIVGAAGEGATCVDVLICPR